MAVTHPVLVTGLLVEEMESRKVRSGSLMIMDDTSVDYSSLMGKEDRKRRYSEAVVDMNTKENVLVQKLYRQIQRQVYCKQEDYMMTAWQEKKDNPLTRSSGRQRSLSVFNENHLVGERKNSLFGPTANGIVTLADLNTIAGIDDEISRIRKSSANMMTEKQKTEILIRENKSQKRATAIVTSGALTFLVVAATMVTASFLMSPTIEEMFGKGKGSL